MGNYTIKNNAFISASVNLGGENKKNGMGVLLAQTNAQTSAPTNIAPSIDLTKRELRRPAPQDPSSNYKEEFPAKEISLEDAMQLFDRNRNVAIAQSNVKIAQAQRVLVNAQNNPLSGEVTVQPWQISGSGSSSFLGGSKISVGFNAFDSGFRGLKDQEALKGVDITNAQLTQVQRDEKYNLKLQFNKVLLAKVLVDVNRQFYKDALETLKQAEFYYKVGTASATDVSRARQSLGAATAAYEGAWRNLRTEEANFSDLLNVKTPKGENAKFTTKGDLKLLAVWDLSLQETEALALQNNPQIDTFRLQKDQAQLAEQAALASGGLKAGVNAQFGLGNGGTANNIQLAPTLTIPLNNDVGAAQARISALNAELASNNEQDAKAGVTTRVREAWQRYQSLGRQIDTARFSVNLLYHREAGADLTQMSAKSIRDIQSLLFINGLQSIAPLNVAQNDLKNARVDLYQLVVDYLAAYNDLARLTGR